MKAFRTTALGIGLLLSMGASFAATQQDAAPASSFAAAAAPTHEGKELQAFRKAIRARYDQKEKDWAAGNAEGIVSGFYDKDVLSVGEAEGMFFGRDQIRPQYLENVKKYTVKIDSVRSYVNGNAGWDWADFIVTPRDAGEKPVTLAMVFLWSKVDGKWICKGESFVFGSLRTGKLEPMTAAAATQATN